MEDLQACRVCLATGVKLYDMYKYKLKNIFEICSGIQVSPTDNYPQYLCCYCRALLQKYDSFRERCRKAQDLMKYAEMKSGLLTTSQIHSIAVSHHTGLPLSVSTPESTTITEVLIKTEEPLPDIVFFKEEVDFSDEEPLANKVKKKEQDIELKVPSLDNDYDDDFIDSSDRIDYDVNVSNVGGGCDAEFDVPCNEIEVVFLTQEEQLKEIIGRKESYNYINSFYKCEQCYKGFIQDGTYQNHMLRHDPIMSYLRNPRLKRIVGAMETAKVTLTIEAPKNQFMDQLNHIPDTDATVSPNGIKSQPCLETTDLCSLLETPTSSIISVDEIKTETIRSSPVLQAHTLPQSVGYLTVDECNTSRNPVNDRINILCLANSGLPMLTAVTADTEISAPGSSIREETSSSSSESSSSSSASCSMSSSSSSTSTSGKDFPPDKDYVLTTLPTRVSFSPSPQCDQNGHLNSAVMQVQDLNNDVTQEIHTHQPTDTNILTKRRRKGCINLSKQQLAKILRNSGQEYTSVSKSRKIVPKMQMGPPCGRKCRIKCSEIIKQEEREIIFNDYWKMTDLIRQRDFISKCISVIQPKYQYKVHNSNRGPKHAFSFEINNCKQRVCKIFFKNTLSISNRPIATVIRKRI